MTRAPRLRTATPGVYQRLNAAGQATRFSVKERSLNGKIGWRGFSSYEEAVLFKERQTKPRKLARPAPPPGEMVEGFVYFIQSGDIGPIKVGWSENGVEQRLATMQTGNPQELRLLGVHYAARPYELALHTRFADQGIRGEWYQPTPELIACALDGPDEALRGWLRERAYGWTAAPGYATEYLPERT